MRVRNRRTCTRIFLEKGKREKNKAKNLGHLSHLYTGEFAKDQSRVIKITFYITKKGMT